MAFAGSDAEYIVLTNIGSEAVALGGWLIGDAETPDDAEGLYVLPEAVLPPGGLYCIARQAEAFHARFGRWPDAALEETAASVGVLARSRSLAHGSLALSDSGDEVLLLSPDLLLADAAAYGDADYNALQLDGQLHPLDDYTLQRVPGALFPFERDVRQRFLLAPARPFESRGLPLSALAPTAPLDEGLIALWGTLGAHSSFTPGYSAPPHYVLAAAAAQGLQFAALADEGVVAAPIELPPGLALLPAWSWRSEGAAIIYNAQPASVYTLAALGERLAGVSAPVQWQEDSSPPLSLAAFGADNIVSEDLGTLFAHWRAMGAPLLPVGNAQPDLPGAVPLAPRFTGLASRSAEPAALLEALADRRGWLTSDANTWLTLRAETETGAVFWMGSWLPAANQITLHIAYGDGDGEAAGLAIWQNGAPLQQLVIPPGDGRWSITLPALPGALLAAAATQADGDFAVTAPLQVAQPAAGSVLINEALPDPKADRNRDLNGDLNGDGKTNSQDEFIELWNPSAEPVALDGWQLVDQQGEVEGGRRYTFPANSLILGGQHLVLWHNATRLSLDDGGDRLRLLDAGGAERDVLGWDASLSPGCAVARLPDGGGRQATGAATPGEPNRTAACAGDKTPASNPLGDLPPVPTLEPAHGQAGGPPGSIAQAKLAGLNAWVEMDGVVTAPPGLFSHLLYVADAVGDGATAGIGVAVYLNQGEFPPLAEGDLVHLAGRWDSYHGEMELVLSGPQGIWKLENTAPLHPLSLTVGDVREWVEGRLVTFRGVVTGWDGDSLFLTDPTNPNLEPVRVTVRSGLPWQRPYVDQGEIWQVTGIVSQYAARSPWNGGYRLLPRYPQDLVCLSLARQE